ncbi:hypothetical protein H4J59_08060 [Colwellia sp. MB02u-10]|uniref:outer membrane beta-barrel protein n=1 Tax=Colwellia sp. MB02u-10 TaxID=2759828 RepID=UPI0015F6E041|nr:outer membrane beta-barrel protein [Colwellia sp. MB02u-10]MBA6340941.1 hypothetical protein [Colwellia sp. MB02u-10]
MNRFTIKLTLIYRLVILSVSVSVSALTLAAEPMSIAVSVGQSQANVRQNHVDITHVDDTDSSWSLEFGYQLEKIAIKVGYVDLGEANVELNAESYVPQTYHEQVKAVAPILAEGWTLGVEVPLYQYEQWFVAGQTGFLFWDNKITSQIDIGERLTTKISDTDIYFGVTASYAVSKSWLVGIQYRNYMLDEPVSDVAIKVNYRF